MSIRGPRCGKHPSHPLVGVCAFCLRERLAGLADADSASDASAHTHTHTHKKKKKKNLSPGPSQPPHRLHHTSKLSANRGSDGPVVANAATCVQAMANNSISHASAVKGCYKNLRPSIDSPHQSSDTPPPKPSTTARIFDQSNGGDALQANVNFDNSVRASTEIPAGRHSFSLANRPSFAKPKSNKPPSIDITMPILESNDYTLMQTNSINHVQKNSQTEYVSSLANDERAKFVVFENRASINSEKSSSSALLGARVRVPYPEVRIEPDMSYSDVSSNPRHKKKTLSSLFSLDDAEFSISKAKADESKNIVHAKGDPSFNGSSSAPTQNSLQQLKTISQGRCRHGSFSERVEPSTYLFPVPEASNSKPLSWFSSFFRRRKKKSHPKSVENLASFSEHNNGWDDARQSWDAPRPSSWEQYGFSSFEGPRTSWEPARPSWEGVMRISDGESVFNGFDFLLESFADRGIEHRNVREDCANGFAEARRVVEGKQILTESKTSFTKTPQLDDKDRARTFLSAKAMLMQRDVSTQTTPPRASDATEIFLQQRQLQHDQHRRRHYVKGSHAVWSKVWTKTFSNPKWAFKNKHQKERSAKDNGDVAIVASDEAGNTTSGRPSFHEGTSTESNMLFNSIKEHDMWDKFVSPSQNNNGGGMVATKWEICAEQDECTDKSKSSNLTLENGLLKFYVTPVRDGHGIRGRSKQGIHVL